MSTSWAFLLIFLLCLGFSSSLDRSYCHWIKRKLLAIIDMKDDDVSIIGIHNYIKKT